MFPDGDDWWVQGKLRSVAEMFAADSGAGVGNRGSGSGVTAADAGRRPAVGNDPDGADDLSRTERRRGNEEQEFSDAIDGSGSCVTSKMVRPKMAWRAELLQRNQSQDSADAGICDGSRTQVTKIRSVEKGRAF